MGISGYHQWEIIAQFWGHMEVSYKSWRGTPRSYPFLLGFSIQWQASSYGVCIPKWRAGSIHIFAFNNYKVFSVEEDFMGVQTRRVFGDFLTYFTRGFSVFFRGWNGGKNEAWLILSGFAVLGDSGFPNIALWTLQDGALEGPPLLLVYKPWIV